MDNLFFALLLTSTIGNAQINQIFPFNDGVARVQVIDKMKSCFIDKTGKRVTAFYTDARDFSEGWAAVEIDGIWKFIDVEENVVLTLPAEYTDVREFSEGLAAVCTGKFTQEKWGYIDKTGKNVIPCKYNGADSFSDGIAFVNYKWSYRSSFYIDKTGGKTIKPEPVEEPIREYRNGYYGYVDKTGKELIPFKYRNAYPFTNGVAYVVKEKVRPGGMITSINVSMPHQAVQTTTVRTRYVDAETKEKAFYINSKGKKLKYECGSYSEGLWMITNIKKWGYMDLKYKVVIPVIYTKATKFSEGLAIVETSKGGNWIIIDKQGEKVADINL